jgi:hypothetical protein
VVVVVQPWRKTEDVGLVWGGTEDTKREQERKKEKGKMREIVCATYLQR